MLRLEHDPRRTPPPGRRAARGFLELAAVLLERAKDPVIAALEVIPWDDEPLTDEERAAHEAALREPAIPWEQDEAELDAAS